MIALDVFYNNQCERWLQMLCLIEHCIHCLTDQAEIRGVRHKAKGLDPDLHIISCRPIQKT